VAKEDKGKVKMTVIHFETESDNETLQENIRSIAQTLSRALTPQQTRIVHAPAQLTSGNGATAEQTQDGEDFVDALDSDFETPTASKSKAKSTAVRQLRSPTLLDLDLTSGDVPFKTFMEQKKPAGDNKRYLVVAQWLKTYLNIDEITMDHVYTCYRSLNWNVPDDAAAPLRSIKAKAWMRKGTTKGAYAITHIGEGVVNDMGQA
jgi:hypothetical protein